MVRNVVLIIGPPGAGKTTLAHTLGLPVYDFDNYGNDYTYTKAVREACTPDDAQVAVIRCCPTRQQQTQWEHLTRATRTLIVDTPYATCKERITRRARPDWQDEIAAARRWHEQRTFRRRW